MLFDANGYNDNNIFFTTAKQRTEKANIFSMRKSINRANAQTKIMKCT